MNEVQNKVEVVKATVGWLSHETEAQLTKDLEASGLQSYSAPRGALSPVLVLCLTYVLLPQRTNVRTCARPALVRSLSRLRLDVCRYPIGSTFLSL